ncbi:hypothetical protein MMC31_004821, partial [Peltigera leucophlebia]|nr:hypothetical protein [Peltigera leucophlebia]
MLTAAVREQHDSTVKYLLKIFPDAGIGAGVTKAAFSHLSIPICTPPHTRLLVSEQQEGQTPIHTFFPGLLGLRARLAVAHAHAQQQMELIEQLVRNGGELRGELKMAVHYYRVDIARCLLDNERAPGGIRGDVMAAAEK